MEDANHKLELTDGQTSEFAVGSDDEHKVWVIYEGQLQVVRKDQALTTRQLRRAALNKMKGAPPDDQLLSVCKIDGKIIDLDASSMNLPTRAVMRVLMVGPVGGMSTMTSNWQDDNQQKNWKTCSTSSSSSLRLPTSPTNRKSETEDTNADQMPNSGAHDAEGHESYEEEELISMEKEPERGEDSRMPSRIEDDMNTRRGDENPAAKERRLGVDEAEIQPKMIPHTYNYDALTHNHSSHRHRRNMRRNFKLRVGQLAGEVEQITVSGDEDILQIKNKISDALGLGKDRFLRIHIPPSYAFPEALRDSMEFADTYINDGDTLLVVQRDVVDPRMVRTCTMCKRGQELNDPHLTQRVQEIFQRDEAPHQSPGNHEAWLVFTCHICGANPIGNCCRTRTSCCGVWACQPCHANHWTRPCPWKQCNREKGGRAHVLLSGPYHHATPYSGLTSTEGASTHESDYCLDDLSPRVHLRRHRTPRQS